MASTANEIAESLRARIETLRAELSGYDALKDELTRLERALESLEPEAQDAATDSTPGDR